MGNIGQKFRYKNLPKLAILLVFLAFIPRRKMSSSEAGSVKTATCLAAFLSFFVLIVCAIVTPMIYTEIQSIWDELDGEMVQFKVF